MREEDPFTDGWTQIATNRVIVDRSRFEVDLNRPPTDAVCCAPEDCWDLQVWSRTVPPEILGETKLIHERFYTELDELLRSIVADGAFVLYDLHTSTTGEASSGRRPIPRPIQK